MRLALLLAAMAGMAGLTAAGEMTVGEVAVGAMQSHAEPVAYREVPMRDFASFVNDWENEKAPLHAVVRSPMEWDAIFTPATTLGNKKPAAPNRAFFAKEQLLVVARVMQAPGRDETPLTVESVVKTGGRAILIYRYRPPAKPAAYMAKQVLLVAVPKDIPGPFEFIEQGPEK